VAPLQGKQVVDRQASAVHAPSRRIALVRGEQEAQRIDQSGAFVQQALPLADRCTSQQETPLLQVAQATMNELGRPARGAPREVALLDQPDPQPQARCFARDPGAGDAAADDQDVQGGFPQGGPGARSMIG